jgi:hypothetical protein
MQWLKKHKINNTLNNWLLNIKKKKLNFWIILFAYIWFTQHILYDIM